MKILVLNSGSSSEKSCLYDIEDTLPDEPPVPAWEGKIEWDGDQAEVQVRNAQGIDLKERLKIGSRRQAIEHLLDTLWSGRARVVRAPSEIEVVGHRVVNGGQEYEEATVITPDVKAAIQGMSLVAPLHNRAELEGIDLIEKRLGSVLQVAVFDTGFHRRMPQPAVVYAGPYEWLAQ